MSNYTTPSHNGRQGFDGVAVRRVIRNLLKSALDESGLALRDVDHVASLQNGVMLWDVTIDDPGEPFGEVAAAIDGAFCNDVHVKEIAHVPGGHYHACFIVNVLNALDIETMEITLQ
jgi:hypothetical protein